MDKHQYIEERLEQQITWYDNKSICHQNTYKRWKLVQIILSASIPFIAGYVDVLKVLAILTGALGVIITSIEGYLSLGKQHENWIEYRKICETLKHEKYMYETGTGVYNTDEKFEVLIERVETIISQENVNWAGINTNKTKC